MDSRHRRKASSERFLTTFSLSRTSTDGGDELNEDDVFFTGANFHNPPSTSSTPPHSIRHKNHHKSFNLGILAALPESTDARRLISPTSPSSSRMIPTIPRKIFSTPANYHQSAPMNITVMSEKHHRKTSVFDCDDGFDVVVVVDDDDDGEMLPPHEIVAKKMADSPMLSSSVLEGVGRTLKGRDLRQVRNAVFRQTGFID
ncbi:protein S40-7 [Beta vulgaris subsp. vulgaris]|uniref:protein S40-7 n=1 Tax=Beta vulgaris subsp. vulgaris TaxID=3555 RepID=UPI0020372E10|nr:protein S40-7 [Beta vulgaris subsp. vulgaris]